MALGTHPKAQEVARLLGDLFDRKVQAEQHTTPNKALGSDTGFVASYADSKSKTVAICVFDLEAAAYLGAALSLIPESRISEMVTNGAIDEIVFENFGEVCNIMLTLFGNAASTEAVKPMAEVTGGAPSRATRLLKSPKRTEIGLNIEGYGSGTVAFAVV
ncbi:MAG: hypothetical protein QNJ97_29140 [Myxococcota bacterium]|nr:hypothetical protein [Myxococcota bacterium]